MLFHPDERMALFIDGANLYSAARSLGFDIDYKRLLDLFAGKGRLIRAFYYTALLEDQEYSPIRPLVDWLDYNGYTLVTKPAKEFTDSAGRRKVKGNMDIELAVDMMEMVDRVDHVVLFSGDGDFRSLIEAVQRKGVRASVVSSIRTQPPMIADELRRQADQFIELDQLAAQIERVHSDRGPRRERPAAPASAPVEADDDLDDDYVDDDYEDDEPPAVVRRTPTPRRG
ncbi:NYN domain-containing protein [Thalassobaculum sp. OXR-137]|uniref:LabA-like NYN domain-containing protein n=1 Tax=Thalassobaculum sp. OXR-137 TaxID=3100173 RepID=UPI002AC8FB8F|nr:NYN domain-containing protein [Thalassobaculum sp. OXR-137]WPZ33029.1 NYN domain-containing protein [Thalassobaculum sp. OXR-137]